MILFYVAVGLYFAPFIFRIITVDMGYEWLDKDITGYICALTKDVNYE